MALIPFLPPPALFSPPPTDGTDAGAVERLPGRLVSVALAPTRRPRASSTAPWLRAGPFPPVPRAQNLLAAATATPPWRARRRAPGPLPARARALQRPQRPIPLLLLLSPRSHAIERRRRSTPYSGKLDAAVEPPHRRSSALSDPLASTASPPRSSPTLSSRQSLTGALPPLFSSAADRLLASRRHRRPPRPRFRASTGAPWSPVAPTPCSPRRRRSPSPVKAGQTPRPSLTWAEDPELEFGKAQGAVCKPKTHMNSAFRDLFARICCKL